VNRRARIALFAFAATLLLGAGTRFALSGGEEPAAPALSPEGAGSGEAPTEEVEAIRDRIVAEAQAEVDAERARELRALDPREDRDHAQPRRRDVRRLARIEADAAAVADEFFAAFARYELGGVDATIRAAFRRTATWGFARTLLAEPPRIPPGVESPVRAELVELQFVARESDPERLEVLAGELVGEVERDGERTPIAIEVVNDGGWRVAGVSR
jgi:hypothetical protein